MAKQHKKQKSAAGVPAHILLAQEAAMPATCFTLRYGRDIEEGFYLRLNQPKPGVHAGVYPPHLAIGHGFIGRDTSPDASCAFRETPNGGLVRRAFVRTVHPSSGGSSFEVLSRPQDDTPSPLLFVSAGVGDRCKLKPTIAGLVWYGVAGSASVICSSAGEALVRFDNDGDHLHVLHPDGSVRQVVRTGWRIVLDEPLSPLEMARVRVDVARAHLSMCDGTEESHNRRSSIVTGMVHLLGFTRRHIEARQPIEEFLRTQDPCKLNAMAAAMLRRFLAPQQRTV